MNCFFEDTIVGVSTPMGYGGIGIIRISGSNSLDVVKKLFKGNIKGKVESHKIYYGNIVDDKGKIIDEVLLSIMLAPKTYTKEDVVEINCHGGIIVINKILQEVIKLNVRFAEPGEFTKRAFINGRIDLSQAEAVIDVINSKTEISRQSSVNQLTGNLSGLIKELRQEVLIMLAHIEASIDYPEHDEENINLENILNKSNQLVNKIEKLINTFETGKIIRSGIETVIIGRPNSGKSSLLNEFLNEDRAIVTDIEGTTRDTLTEYVNINNILLKITDTAGIRHTNDFIEKIGVEKSKKHAQNADLILMMIDSSKSLSPEDLQILSEFKNKKLIILLNKIDLNTDIDIHELKNFVDEKFIVHISVKEKIGLDKLQDLIVKLFFNGEIMDKDEVIITKLRHKTSLINSLNSLKNVINSICSGFSEDIAAIDLQNCYAFLGEIIGEYVDEDVIDKVFSEFCLGK